MLKLRNKGLILPKIPINVGDVHIIDRITSCTTQKRVLSIQSATKMKILRRCVSSSQG